MKKQYYVQLQLWKTQHYFWVWDFLVEQELELSYTLLVTPAAWGSIYTGV